MSAKLETLTKHPSGFAFGFSDGRRGTGYFHLWYREDIQRKAIRAAFRKAKIVMRGMDESLTSNEWSEEEKSIVDQVMNEMKERQWLYSENQNPRK